MKKLTAFVFATLTLPLFAQTQAPATAPPTALTATTRSATAPTEALRPLVAAHGDKRLPIGTPVWANSLADGVPVPCGHHRTEIKAEVRAECFEGYRGPYGDPYKYARNGIAKARIVGYRSGRPAIEFLDTGKEEATHRFTYKVYKMINVWDWRAKYSLYVALLVDEKR